MSQMHYISVTELSSELIPSTVCISANHADAKNGGDFVAASGLKPDGHFLDWRPSSPPMLEMHQKLSVFIVDIEIG